MTKFIKIKYKLMFYPNSFKTKYINISSINEIYEGDNDDGNTIIKTNYNETTYNLEESFTGFINRLNDIINE